jgi:hypothetical protein
MRRLALCAPCLALVCLAFGGGAVPGPASADERFLKEQGVATDGAALLDFVKKRTLDSAALARIKKLVADLGDEDFDVRERASRALVELGIRARPFLRQARSDPDLEVRKRAERALAAIDRDCDRLLQVSAAVVRLLARKKPAGACGVLFNYLGSAEDEAIAEEVRLALPGLAVRDGKPEAVLLAGLKDSNPVRRAAAAVAFCRAGVTGQMPAVRKLLADPDVSVRFPVALALAGLREKEAVGALVGLLDRIPARQAGLVEEMLCRLAGDKAPAIPPGTDEGRRRYHKAWQAWWKDHGARVEGKDLVEAVRDLGCTTVVMLDDNKVLELDWANRVRWQLGGLAQPLDVQRLPGNRVLLAEYKANRVTERDTTGKVVREHRVPEPLVAQRLEDGSTFVANPYGLVVLDRAGKEVFNYRPPNGEAIMRAKKLPGGDIALITQLAVPFYVRLDKMGKQLKRFGVQVTTSGGRIELTPAGNVLVPEMNNNRVVERDPDGKEVREVRIQQPIAAVCLANGHWLVTSMTQNRAVEFDRSGKEVWEYRRTSRVTRAVRP